MSAHILGPENVALKSAKLSAGRFVGKSVKDPRVVGGWVAIKSRSCRACFDARLRSFRGFPILCRSIAVANLCTGSGRGGEGEIPISLGLFAINLAPAGGRGKVSDSSMSEEVLCYHFFTISFTNFFCLKKCSDLSPTQLSGECGLTVCLFGQNCSCCAGASTATVQHPA